MQESEKVMKILKKFTQKSYENNCGFQGDDQGE